MRIPSPTQRLAGSGARRRIAAAAALVVVVAVVIGVVVSAGAPASSKGQSSNNSAPSGSAAVQRRNLVETDTESGTLGYSNAQTVFNRLSGTITYLPGVGQVVQPGGTLYQVNGYPVVLFNGSYPAYRVLKSGDKDGPDIEQLNSDLKAMGYDPYDAIVVDDVWQTATTDAVERFQAAIGVSQTGKLKLGQIVFLPGAQLVNAVDTTIGSTGGSAGSPSGSGSGNGSGSGADNTDPTSTPTNVSDTGAGQPRPQFVDLTRLSATGPGTGSGSSSPGTTGTTPSTTTTPTTTTPTTPTTPSPSSGSTGSGSASGLAAIVQLLRTQNRLLQAELHSALGGNGSGSGGHGGNSGTNGHSGNSGNSGTGNSGNSGTGKTGNSGTGNHGSPSSSGGGGGGSATAILSTTSTQLVVTVQLDATKQSEAKLHEPVTVQLPDGSTVNGRITAVSSVATNTSSGGNSNSPSSNAPSATIPVTIALDKHANTAGLDQAAVSVNFEQAVAKHVLSVPVTALLATQGGGYAVELATVPHKLVPVTPGLFAAGYVQISGSGLYAGMQVTDSQG